MGSGNAVNCATNSGLMSQQQKNDIFLEEDIISYDKYYRNKASL